MHRTRCRLLGLLCLVGLTATAGPAAAQTDYFWNAPTGGTGTWANAIQNWSSTTTGPADYTWGTDTAQQRANFGGTAGTVTLGTHVTAYGLNFLTDGYTVTGGTNMVTMVGPGGVVDTGAFTATINAIIADTSGFGLTKNGAGRLVLGGANTYGGATAVNAGVVAISTATGLGNAVGATTVAGGAAVEASGAITVAEAITLNGTGISNGGALRKTGANTTTWNGVITVAVGGARIHADAGTLDIRPGANGIAGSGQTLTFGGNGNITIGGIGNILNLGTGTLNKEGSGVLTIENSNGPTTFDGPVNVTGGVLSVGVSTALGTEGVITLNGGTLRNTSASSGTSFITSMHPIAIGSNGGTVDVATAGVALIYAPIGTDTISGAGNTLTKTGPGEFRYQNAGTALSSFSRLVVNQGLFRLGNVPGQNFETGFGAVPGNFLADAITLNGGAIGTSFGVTLNANRGITLGAAGGTLDLSSAPMTIPGEISGSGPLTKNGAQQLTLSGANTYTGATALNAGVTIISTNTALGTVAAGTTVASGAALQTGSALVTAEPLTLNGTGVSSGGALRKTGANTTTWAGPITLATAARINADAGTLAINTGGISGPGDLTVGGAGVTTINAPVTTAGTLTKDGTGTLNLNGTNTYAGATAVNAGTLAGIGSATSTVTVAANARILGGDGAAPAAGQTLTVGGLSVANTGAVRATVGSGATFDNTTATGASLVDVNGAFGRATATATDKIHIELNLVGGGFDDLNSTQYTRRVLTYDSLSNLTAGAYSTGGAFEVTGVNFSLSPGWQVLVGQSGNVVDVTFSITPVPEPGTVLAVAAAGLGLTGLARRRLRRRDATLAA